jgi:hypothetical protein
MKNYFTLCPQLNFTALHPLRNHSYCLLTPPSSLDRPVIPFPFILPHPDDLIAILLRKFWVDAVVRYGIVFSPTNSPFSLFTHGDQRLSQWGLGQGTHVSAFSLQPRRPNKKFPGLKIPQTEQKSKSSVLNIWYSPIIEFSFPLLSPIKYGPFTYATNNLA